MGGEQIGENGNDGDNLSITTGSLTYTNLKDNEENEQTGFTASVSGHNPFGVNDGKPKGETNIGLTDIGTDKEGITHVIIGQGQITVGGNERPELAGLDRDTDNAQEVTKNEQTGALSSNLTINHAAFDAKTWENLADLPENLVTAADNARVSAHLVGELLTIELADNLYKNWDSPTNILDEVVADFKRGDKQNQLYQTTSSKDSVRIMWKFDSDESVKDNVQNILENHSDLLKDGVEQKLRSLLALGADDNNLLGTMLTPLYSEFVKNGVVEPTSTSGLVNPMDTLANMFDLTLDPRDYISSALGLQRGCCEGGDGAFGAPRTHGSPHDGIDILAKPDALVFAANDGTVSLSSASGFPLIRVHDSDNPDLYNTSASLYVLPNVGANQLVQQGDVIGSVANLKNNPAYNNVPNHVHFRIESAQYDHDVNRDYTNPTNLIFKNK